MLPPIQAGRVRSRPHGDGLPHPPTLGAGRPWNDGTCRPRTSPYTGFAFEDLDLGRRQSDGLVSRPLEVDGRADAATERLPLPLWQVWPALFLESRDGLLARLRVCQGRLQLLAGS